MWPAVLSRSGDQVAINATLKTGLVLFLVSLGTELHHMDQGTGCCIAAVYLPCMGVVFIYGCCSEYSTSDCH